MKEEWKGKVQITFPAPSVKFRCPVLAFQCFEYLICFLSYQACDYIVTKPRTWPTCWSSSDENRLSSHGDIHPAIQMFISLVTMEPTSLLAHYSTIAADHDYTLLEGQPLSQLPDTSWYILSLPAPQSLLFLVSVSSSSVSHPAYSLVISGILSGLKGLIWSSLCSLSPLPMVLVSHAPAKSSFPSHS